MTETILEPGLPIVDPHHHLWVLDPPPGALTDSPHPCESIRRAIPRYLFDDLLSDTRSGHNIVGTVYVECRAFYRADGPAELRPVGEVEYVNDVAAQSDSGRYGSLRACAGIVGHADLARGVGAADVLEAEIAAGNGRFRGVRQAGAYDADGGVLGPIAHAPAGLYADSGFREGFAHLGRLGLTFDAWVLEPQIPEVTDLARAFPETSMVLDHVGTPLGISNYRDRRGERFEVWHEAIRDLASCPNVMIKLGGLAMPFPGFPDLSFDIRPTSETLAGLWQPYIETCIDAFGPARSMFESNFPMEKWGADYATIWNAFKRLAAGASADEKRQLFAGTATRFYKLDELHEAIANAPADTATTA